MLKPRGDSEFVLLLVGAVVLWLGITGYEKYFKNPDKGCLWMVHSGETKCLVDAADEEKCFDGAAIQAHAVTCSVVDNDLADFTSKMGRHLCGPIQKTCK